MDTREKEIVARLDRAFRDEIHVPVGFAPDVPIGKAVVYMQWDAAKELHEMLRALRTPPSSGGAVELYRRVPYNDPNVTTGRYERATKAEAVCKAALMWADKPTPENTIALERAAGALGVDL
jgi:hypothetical protein